MDTTLHCNDLKCRATVTDCAVVTTCSHIFCLPCAKRLELTAPQDGQRKCPACHTYLLNLDDAVVASLNPTEDYKTSILSGLSPTVIMECAGRGLSFWAYQMAQEITYQEFLARSLADRYTGLQAESGGLARKMGDENKKLKGSLEAFQNDNAELLERCHSLDKQYKAKEHEMKKWQNLYYKLKNETLNPNMESAADHEIDKVLQAGVSRRESQQQRPRDSGVHRTRSNNSGSSGDQRQHGVMQNDGYGTQTYRPSQAIPDRSTMGTSNSQYPPASQNRQPLPQPTFGSYNNTIRQGVSVESLRQGTPRGHSGLSSFQAGSPNGGAPGLTANARVGRTAVDRHHHLQVPGVGMHGSRAGPYAGSRSGYIPGGSYGR